MWVKNVQRNNKKLCFIYFLNFQPFLVVKSVNVILIHISLNVALPSMQIHALPPVLQVLNPEIHLVKKKHL